MDLFFAGAQNTLVIYDVRRQKMRIRRTFTYYISLILFCTVVGHGASALEIDEAKELYQELLGFKRNPKFHQLGFAPASPYNAWYKRIKALQAEGSVDQQLLKKRVVVGDILMLGQEYRKTKGQESEYTRFMTGEFNNAFAIETAQ